MDSKKRILLGEKDILSKDNEDLFINVSLNSTFSEIRDYKYDNVFDVEKQFKKERNASRDFRIYGTIDSTITDCDNLKLSVYHSAYSGSGISSGVTILSGFVKSLSSTTMVYDGLNVYNKKKGKYLIELTGYTHDFVYIKILSNNSTYRDQIYAQQLIFKDAEGLFMDYGTQTIEIDENGNALEINNDFYFLYNKHWVKKDLLIVEEKPAIISFSASPLVETTTETLTNRSLFSVVLSKPSPFGLESADLSVLTSTLDASTEISVFNSSLVAQTLPHTINFSIGEQVKNFYFLSPEDILQEFTEDVTFELTNFNNVNTGSPLNHTFFVTDTTARNRAIFNFQNIYQNRNYFNGQVLNIGGFSTTSYSSPMPSVLRNGLMFEGEPEEFYPSDNFSLKIKNIGVSTILPVNTALGIFTEQIFPSGQELQFGNINIQYTNSEKHSIDLYFGTQTFAPTQGVVYNAMYSGVTINNIPLVDYWAGSSYKFDYDTVLACLKKLPRPSGGIAIGGWNRYNLDTPFDVIENLTALTITLIAKSPGTRLDIKTYGFAGDLYDINDAITTEIITAVTTQEFVYAPQIPLEITLAANVGGNSQVQYEFEFSKTGFDSMSFTNTPVTALVTPPTYYLASSDSTILRNWDDALNQPVYVHTAVSSDLGNSPQFPGGKYGLYNVGEIYMNGLVFLSNLYFDNTTNTSAFLPGGNSINVSHAHNTSNDFTRDFFPSPIATIPATSEFYSPQNSVQVGFLGIRLGNGSYITDPDVNVTRSFDFRTGTTGPYNTYYFNNYITSKGAWEWGTYNSFFSSGGTAGATHTTYPTLSIREYLQDGNSTYGIVDQGIDGTIYSTLSNTEANSVNATRGPNSFFGVLDFIKLSGRTSGVPFEIKNFVEMRYLSGPNNGTNFSNDTMCYVETQPSEILGVTINKANNHMGGFSLTRPI